MTFEEYLVLNSYPNKKTPDHTLRMQVEDIGVTFYIHPHGEDGDTADFLVKGNSLLPNPKIISGK